jgi:hypothetical protein
VALPSREVGVEDEMAYSVRGSWVLGWSYSLGVGREGRVVSIAEDSAALEIWELGPPPPELAARYTSWPRPTGEVVTLADADRPGTGAPPSMGLQPERTAAEEATVRMILETRYWAGS